MNKSEVIVSCVWIFCEEEEEKINQVHYSLQNYFFHSNHEVLYGEELSASQPFGS